MKERPILFSGPMVRAILEGRKTQTRRVMKPQPVDYQDHLRFPWATFYNNGHVHTFDRSGVGGQNWMATHYPNENKYSAALLRTPYTNPCPFGSPGDRLWVRETWGEVSHIDWGDPTRHEFVHVLGPDERNIIYREEASRHGFEWVGEDEADRWRPSIHMPRWASRITLEVVSVRVERLQDISDADAIAEGYDHGNAPGVDVDINGETWSGSYRRAFLSGAWAKSLEGNPWVWVVEFKRAEVAK